MVAESVLAWAVSQLTTAGGNTRPSRAEISGYILTLILTVILTLILTVIIALGLRENLQ